MRMSKRVLLVSTLALGTSALRPSLQAAPRALNRSLYIPVAFRLCPHLTRAVILVDDQVVATLPSDRIFQFTYYPELKRIAPEVIQLEVRGERIDGEEPFVGRIALTPNGIHTAAEHIPIDLTKEMGKLRYRVDVHSEKVFLRIKCRSDCPMKDAPVPTPTTAASSSSSSQIEHKQP